MNEIIYVPAHFPNRLWNHLEKFLENRNSSNEMQVQELDLAIDLRKIIASIVESTFGVWIVVEFN